MKPLSALGMSLLSPTMSSIPASFGSAIEQPAKVIAATQSLAMNNVHLTEYRSRIELVIYHRGSPGTVAFMVCREPRPGSGADSMGQHPSCFFGGRMLYSRRGVDAASHDGATRPA